MIAFRTNPRANHAMLAAALSIGALSAGNAAAGGLIQYEVGTEDVGLAAAGYAARAQDATTVFTNPAGMTRLDGQQIQLGTQLLYSNLKFSIGAGTDTRPPPLGLGAVDGGNAVGSDGWFPGGGFFYSYSVSPNLKLGFASTGNFGLGLKYDDNWVGRYYVQQATLIGASFLPSIAYRVNEQFSIGASINAMYGYMKSVTAINNVRDTLPDGKLVYRDTTWGWGGNVGVLYEPTRDFRFGLTYSSQVKLDFTAPAQFSGTGPVLTGVLAARGLLNAPLGINFTVPQQVMGSVVGKLDDRWTLMGNVGWQQWSKFGMVEVSIDSSNPTSVTTAVPFKDTWHAAVGAQYQLSQPWRLNFGIAYDSGFQPNASNVSPIIPGNSAWRFAVGGQNQVSKTFSWGIAGEYVAGGTLDTNKVQSPAVPIALGGRGNLVGSYSNVNTFYGAANFNWKF